MKQLKDILYKVSLTSVVGSTGEEVRSVCFDSRKVEKKSLFIAIKGIESNGHDYIDAAIEKGATSVVCEILPGILKEGVTYVTVRSSSEALGLIASNFYDNPSSKLKVVGITGTNGKTTTATLLYNLFMLLGYKVGLLSTVSNHIGKKIFPATHTTPDALQLNYLLSEMVNAGCSHCFMEVSSHAIEQNRVKGLNFAGAVFSNITHDHLDYHGSFEAYIKAKKKLFDFLPADAFALINADDKNGKIMVQNTKAEVHSYSLKTISEYKGKVVGNSFQGLEMDINGREVWFKLIGTFNAYNILAVYGVGLLLGEDEEEVLLNMSKLEGVNGRFERMQVESQIIGLVDYAHTPDALENVLKNIEYLRTGNEKVITVVGCGGNRDKEKRPLMAEIAARFSDKIILTSDNPRFEDPVEIIREMEKGLSPVEQRKSISITDREEAIKAACMMANPFDIILVAGKGHETYQEIKGERFPFDDKEILGRFLTTLTN